MRESKNMKLPGVVKSPEILNPKSKVNTLYLITFKSAMFCGINNSSNKSWYFEFPPSIIRVSGKTKVSCSWVYGALKITMARVPNLCVYIKTNSASVDNTLLDLLNSSYPTKAEFINVKIALIKCIVNFLQEKEIINNFLFWKQTFGCKT